MIYCETILSYMSYIFTYTSSLLANGNELQNTFVRTDPIIYFFTHLHRTAPSPSPGSAWIASRIGCTTRVATGRLLKIGINLDRNQTQKLGILGIEPQYMAFLRTLNHPSLWWPWLNKFKAMATGRFPILKKPPYIFLSPILWNYC